MCNMLTPGVFVKLREAGTVVFFSDHVTVLSFEEGEVADGSCDFDGAFLSSHS